MNYKNFGGKIKVGWGGADTKSTIVPHYISKAELCKLRFGTVSKDLLHQNFLLQRDCSIKKFGCHFNCNKNLTLWISLICGSYKLWEDGLLKTFYKIIFPLVRTIFLAFYVAIMHAVI